MLRQFPKKVTQTVRRSMCDSSQIAKCTKPVLAIRREELLWERRAPLSADHVRELCQKDIKVIVQSCNRRVFSNESYSNAGAEIREDISDASVIIGVKEISIEHLLPDKTYCFFLHATKGEPQNTAILAHIISNNIRLIDYEFLLSSDQKKIPKVVFSRYAGIAGFTDILHGLGIRLLALGYGTPYLHIGMAHMYRRSFSALMNVREVGYEIALGQMPKSIGPMVFAFLGTGHATKGAQEVFEHLPFEYIEVKDLPQIHEKGSTTKVYGVVIGTKDYLRKKDGGDFNREEFRQHPDRYVSVFAKEVAPYASVVVNGLYWKPGYPKLLTKSDAQKLLQARPKTKSDSHLGSDLPHRLLAICEISADPYGAFEFIDKCTTIEFPFFICDVNQQQRDVAYRGPGILICSIDNMPSQFAMEATESFGKLLLPYMDNILSSDATKPLEEHNLHKFVREAIIASNGKLQPEFQYIDHYIKGLQK